MSRPLTEPEPGRAQPGSGEPAGTMPETIAYTESKPAGLVPERPTLAGYEILEELGRGGMGVVYRARDARLHRLVALKMILFREHARTEELARFQAEAEAVAQLQHPNIVQIHEVGEESGLPFLCLEYVDGGSLAQKLKGKPLLPKRAAQLMGILAGAVQAAHRRGIIHRDLKPGNVLLARSESSLGVMLGSGTEESGPFEPKLTDFGLAKRLDSDGSQTRSGTIVGTPNYMAPEQAQGHTRDITPATDVYSLGTILYELLTGRPPFNAATPMETMVQVISNEPVPPRRLQPGVPLDLETICLKCLQKEPRKRYATAQELADDLTRFQNAEPILARPVGRLERGWRWCRRNPILAPAAGLALAGLIGTIVLGVIFLVHQTRSTTRLREEKDLTQKALAETKVQRAAAERLSASLSLDRGRTLCEQGEVSWGLLWLAHSLEITPPDSEDLERAIRANLSHWSRETRQQRAFWQLGGVPGSATSAASFSADGKRALIVCQDKTARLFDTETGADIATLKHDDQILAAVFNPDGRMVCTGSQDKTVRLWDSATGKALGEPIAHAGPVYSVAFSPDQSRLLTGSMGVACLWDPATRKLVGKPLLLPAAVIAVAFSPDGKTFLTATVNGKVNLWATATVKALGETLVHPDDLTSAADLKTAAVNPDGESFLTARTDGQVRIWSVTKGQVLCSFHHQAALNQAVFSPDGKTVLTVGGSNTARLWYAATGQPKGLLFYHLGNAICAAFSPDGKNLITGSYDTLARVWDVATGKPLGPPLQHQNYVNAVAFSPDGKFFLSACQDQTARLWNTGWSKSLGGPLDQAGQVKGVAVSKDGGILVTGSTDSFARLWDLGTGRIIGPRLAHPRGINAVTISPDGRLVLTGCTDGKARRWSVATGKEMEPALPHGPSVCAVAISPDGSLLLTGGTDSTARLWDARTGQPAGAPMRHKDAVWGVAFSPDGKYLATAVHDNTVGLWETATQKPVGQPFRHQAPVWAVAFSPDGRLVLSGSEDRTAQLWDMATGKPVGAALTHQGPVKTVAFAPDGRTIVTGDTNNAAYVWDVNTGKRIGPDLRHKGWVNGVAFSPDGRMLVTGADDATAQRWEAPPSLEGSVEQIRLWTQVITGLEMDDAGAFHALDVATWTERRRQLQQAGGSPVGDVSTPVFQWSPEAEAPRVSLSMKRLERRLQLAGWTLHGKFTTRNEYVQTGLQRFTLVDRFRPWKESLPAVDLRPKFVDFGVYEARSQGSTDLCSILAVTGAYEFMRARKVKPESERLSEQFLWWATKKANGLDHDKSYLFHEIIKGITTHGMCTDREMPFRAEAKSPGEPTMEILNSAAGRKCFPRDIHWLRENDGTFGIHGDTLDDIKTCLRWGYPVACGLAWAPEFDKDTLAVMPAERPKGGHSILLVGFYLSQDMAGGGAFIFRNNAGPKWGDEGYGYLPFDYVGKYGADAFVFTLASGGRPALPAVPSLVIEPWQPPAKPVDARQISAWISDLTDSRHAVRDKAASSLVEAGPPASKLLEAGLAKLDKETRGRAMIISTQIEIRAAVAPKLIGLKLKGAPLPEAVAALAEQTGIKLYLKWNSLLAPPKITLALEGVPLWEALDRFCRSAGLTCDVQSGNSAVLSPGPSANAGICSYSGPCRFVAAAMRHHRSTHAAFPELPPMETLALTCTILVEPQSSILATGMALAVEAVDDRGNNLVFKNSMALIPDSFEAHFPYLQTRERLLPLVPPKHSNATLKHLKGVLPVEVMLRRRELVTIPDVDMAKGQIFLGADGLRLTVNDVQRDGTTRWIRLSLEEGGKWKYDAGLSRFELADSQGRRYVATNPVLGRRVVAMIAGPAFRPEHLACLSFPPLAAYPGNMPWPGLAAVAPPRAKYPSWQGNIPFYNVEGGAAKTKLTIYGFKKARVDLPFEFRNLRMP